MCSSMQGMLHTHPNGVPYPSRQDIKEMKIAPQYISCIYANYITCWRYQTDKVVRLQVVESSIHSPLIDYMRR